MKTCCFCSQPNNRSQSRFCSKKCSDQDYCSRNRTKNIQRAADWNKKNGRTIDRIDADGHYEPSNVRVVCKSCNNRQAKKILTVDQDEEIRKTYIKGSRTQGIVALAKKHGVSQDTIWRTINSR